MKRAAVFAHYDKDNIIDDYVIYYLKALKELAHEIVFVSCKNLSDTEKSKLDGIADFIIAENHDEYDFGSYKRGYLYLKDRLNDFDELIFANDSCYGPLYSLHRIFDEMEREEHLDFWGITKNKFGLIKKNDKYIVTHRPHIQSYFVVFSKKIFLSDVFDKFMASVKHLDCKNDIVMNYEIGLSETLTNAGFQGGTYIKALYRFNHVLLSFWRLLIEKYNMPFVKCSVLRLQNETLTTIAGWQDCISEKTDYPVSLIEENLKRTSKPYNPVKFIPNFIKIFYFYFIAVQPGLTKRYLVKLNHGIVKLFSRFFAS